MNNLKKSIIYFLSLTAVIFLFVLFTNDDQHQNKNSEDIYLTKKEEKKEKVKKDNDDVEKDVQQSQTTVKVVKIVIFAFFFLIVLGILIYFYKKRTVEETTEVNIDKGCTYITFQENKIYLGYSCNKINYQKTFQQIQTYEMTLEENNQTTNRNNYLKNFFGYLKDKQILQNFLDYTVKTLGMITGEFWRFIDQFIDNDGKYPFLHELVSSYIVVRSKYCPDEETKTKEKVDFTFEPLEIEENIGVINLNECLTKTAYQNIDDGYYFSCKNYSAVLKNIFNVNNKKNAYQVDKRILFSTFVSIYNFFKKFVNELDKLYKENKDNAGWTKYDFATHAGDILIKINDILFPKENKNI